MATLNRKELKAQRVAAQKKSKATRAGKIETTVARDNVNIAISSETHARLQMISAVLNIRSKKDVVGLLASEYCESNNIELPQAVLDNL